MSASFRQMMTVAYTTKRLPAKVAGRQGPATPYLVDPGLRCTPLDPVSVGSDVVKRLAEQLGRQLHILETFTPNLDITEGDVLVVTGREYPVRLVEHWDWRRTRFLRLLVEDL